MFLPKPPVLRFAPSPTGSLHLGGLRTALYNYLFAKKHGGKWILRIEDTDTRRFQHGAVDNIRKSLEWAGLEYDYGPGVGGPHTTYFQSERLELYHYHANRLVQSGHAYHCFCTPVHLGNIKEHLAKRGSNETYDKRCLHLSEEEVGRRKRAGNSFVIRLNDESPPAFVIPSDVVFGLLKDAHNSLPTDPILYKSDGYPTYHLASVVDDHEMGITHVLRGEEWLPSLPLHLDLYACLGFIPPQFAHLPLLLNPDGSKMSKRNGDVSITDYMGKGWMASAVLNWLALAGWGKTHTHGERVAKETSEKKMAPASTEMFTLPDLIKKFDLSVITPRRTILDPRKLKVLNAKHFQQAMQDQNSLEKLADTAKTLVSEKYKAEEQRKVIAELDFKQLLLLTKDRLKNVNELPPLLEFLFTVPTPTSTTSIAGLNLGPYGKVAKKYLDAIEATRISETPWNEATILGVEALRTEPDELAYVRRALTGKKAGLPLATVMLLLGREETLVRLGRVVVAFQWME